MSLDDPPTVAEVAGSDAIPAEIDKAGCTQPCATIKTNELFETIWSAEGVPHTFKDASTVHLYTRKGNRLCCDNHRGISFLLIAGEILARVLLNRLLVHIEQGLLPESQCGFRKGRGTIDMILQHDNYRKSAKNNIVFFSQHLLISARHSIRFAARESE